MKKHFGSREDVRGIRRWLTPITALAIVLLIALNIGLAALLQYKSLYVDLTPEGLYTLSDGMIRECNKVNAEITITFCDDPDRLLASYDTRYVYVMATELANRYDNITVETYNLTLNPTALDRFRTTSASSLSADRVIVSCGDRYRTYSAKSFWVTGSDSTDGSYWAFNGEYVMATAFFSLSLIENPVAYYVYNHGESYYVSPEDTANAALAAGSDEQGAAFYDLLIKAGLKVGYLDLGRVSEIPDDCACLIINGPQTDLLSKDPSSYYARSESELLDRYLAGGNGALMIFKDPDVVGLTNLTQFAEKWGISYVDGSIVKDAQASLGDASGTPADLLNTKLISKYNYNEESYAHSVYSDISAIDSAPAVIVDRTGSVKRYFPSDSYLVSGNTEAGYTYSDFLYSSETARTYTTDGNGYLTGEDGSYPLAALTVRDSTDSYSFERYNSYLFCAATTALTENTYLTNAAYANYDVLFALVRYISGLNSYADMDLGGTSPNSENMGGKTLQYSKLDDAAFTDSITRKECAAFTDGSMTLWCIVVLAVPLLTVATVAAVVCVRRRFL